MSQYTQSIINPQCSIESWNEPCRFAFSDMKNNREQRENLACLNCLERARLPPSLPPSTPFRGVPCRLPDQSPLTPRTIALFVAPSLLLLFPVPLFPVENRPRHFDNGNYAREVASLSFDLVQDETLEICSLDKPVIASSSRLSFPRSSTWSALRVDWDAHWAFNILPSFTSTYFHCASRELGTQSNVEVIFLDISPVNFFDFHDMVIFFWLLW